jgi:hypothetical protein
MGQFSAEKPVPPGSTLSGNQQSAPLSRKNLIINEEISGAFDTVAYEDGGRFGHDVGATTVIRFHPNAN